MIEKRTLYSPDPETDEMQKPTFNRNFIPGTLSEVLVSDDSSIFMRQERVFGDEPVEKKHLFSTAGLRDSTWFDRTFWAMGKTEERSSSRLLVFDDKTVYGITEAFGKKISSAGKAIPCTNSSLRRWSPDRWPSSRTTRGKPR